MPSYKLYDTLGVDKQANGKDIKRAFHKMSLEHHPDKGGDPEKFKEIANAYQVLSDDEKRAQYDQLGDERYNEQAAGGGGGMDGMGGIDPRDLFAQFFGGAGFPFGGGGGGFHPHHHRPTKCPNHRHVWQITLSDAYFGVEKILKVTTNRPCRQCLDTCYACQGRGSITHLTRMGMFTQMSTQPCNECQGRGKKATVKTGCSECHGKGQISCEHRVELKAPRGVQTGHVLQFSRLGEQSLESDEHSGDLLVEVMVQPHPVFRREGNDLHIQLPIGFSETVTGKMYDIPHFEESIVFSSATCGIIEPGKNYALTGKGMPGGHLVIQFKIEYPKIKLSDTQRDQLRTAFQSVGL